VYGRGFHRPSVLPVHNTPPYGGSELPPPPAPPPEPRPQGRPGRFRSGKSGFPARAGFWGRRNSHGEIVPLTDPALRPGEIGRWRSVVLPHVAVVLASALLSFGAVMLVMKLRERPPEATPPRPLPAAPVAVPLVAPAATAPTAPPVPVAPAPVSPRARPSAVSDAVIEPDWRPRRPPNLRPGGRAKGDGAGPGTVRRVDRGSRVDPDGTLAPSFR
jgi:hypothetical protein